MVCQSVSVRLAERCCYINAQGHFDFFLFLWWRSRPLRLYSMSKTMTDETSAGLVATRLQKPVWIFRVVAVSLTTTIAQVLQYCISLWQHAGIFVLSNGVMAAPGMLLCRIPAPGGTLHLTITTCSTGKCPTLDENLGIPQWWSFI